MTLKVAVIFYHNPYAQHLPGFGTIRRADKCYDAQAFLWPTDVQVYINSLYEKGFDSVQVMDRRLYNENAVALIRGQIKTFNNTKVIVSTNKGLGLPFANALSLIKRLKNSGIDADESEI